MLRTLSIRDFVIVDSIELEFSAGFTVFTGETGAGKSILIDALTLALGGRGDASVVREGAAKADITADFSPSAQAAEWLQAHEFAVEEGGAAKPTSTAWQPLPPSCVSWAIYWWTSTASTPTSR